MDQNNHFQYFYNQAADMFTFYRIPKLLFTDERFKDISTEAKLLYGIMLDRMSLSTKNQWFDSEGRVYIYFSIEDVMEHLNCKKNKAVDTMKELDSITGIGLIEKKRQGQGKPARIYVKNFMTNINYGFAIHNLYFPIIDIRTAWCSEMKWRDTMLSASKELSSAEVPWS